MQVPQDLQVHPEFSGSLESLSKRLNEFYKRLSALPSARSAREAREQLTTTLNEVEDEMTSIPYNPDNWQSDGRLYSPRNDSRREVPGRKDIVRFRHLAHNTFFGKNGSIEIQNLKRDILFQKTGADGNGVRDQ